MYSINHVRSNERKQNIQTSKVRELAEASSDGKVTPEACGLTATSSVRGCNSGNSNNKSSLGQASACVSFTSSLEVTSEIRIARAIQKSNTCNHR